MTRVTRDWLQVNCLGFIEKNHWPADTTDLNPLDYHVWVTMLEKYRKLQLKPRTIDELKVALQTVWEELPQEHEGGGKFHQALNCLHVCQWWSLRASAVRVYFQACILISTSKTGS